jgi:cytochrome P450
LSSTTERLEIDDDLFAPALIADPFPYYDRLREVDPVHWNEQNKVWIVTRYDAIEPGEEERGVRNAQVRR